MQFTFTKCLQDLKEKKEKGVSKKKDAQLLRTLLMVTFTFLVLSIALPFRSILFRWNMSCYSVLCLYYLIVPFFIIPHPKFFWTFLCSGYLADGETVDFFFSNYEPLHAGSPGCRLPSKLSRDLPAPWIIFSILPKLIFNALWIIVWCLPAPSRIFGLIRI